MPEIDQESRQNDLQRRCSRRKKIKGHKLTRPGKNQKRHGRRFLPMETDSPGKKPERNGNRDESCGHRHRRNHPAPETGKKWPVHSEYSPRIVFRSDREAFDSSTAASESRTNASSSTIRM